MCIGDFNDLETQAKKQGGNVRNASRLWSFQSFLFDCGLLDLKFNGASFTCLNNQLGEAHIKERLDKAVCNSKFL